MGNTLIRNNQEQPDLKGWQANQKLNTMTLWTNSQDPTQEIEEYPLYLNDESEFAREKELYLLRKHHPSLVASLFFQQSAQKDFCSTVFKGSLFLERIPVRLSNVTDIPFPDILHLYSQALNGFQLLSKSKGFFLITEQNIGINKDGIAKVWLNKQFEKSFPSEEPCSEEAMVRNILEIIQNNTDPESMQNRSVLTYIYSQNPPIKFNQAIESLNQYIAQFYKGQIPTKLFCVSKAGGTQALVHRYQAINSTNPTTTQNHINTTHIQQFNSTLPPQNLIGTNHFSEQMNLATSNVVRNSFFKKNKLSNQPNIGVQITHQPYQQIPQQTHQHLSHQIHQTVVNPINNNVIPLVQAFPIVSQVHSNRNVSVNFTTNHTNPSNHINSQITPFNNLSNASYPHAPSQVHTHKPSQFAPTNQTHNRPSSFHNNSTVERVKNHPLVQVIENSSAEVHRDPQRTYQIQQIIKPQSAIMKRMVQMSEYGLVKPSSPAPPRQIATGVRIHRSQKKTQQLVNPNQINHVHSNSNHSFQNEVRSQQPSIRIANNMNINSTHLANNAIHINSNSLRGNTSEKNIQNLTNSHQGSRQSRRAWEVQQNQILQTPSQQRTFNFQQIRNEYQSPSQYVSEHSNEYIAQDQQSENRQKHSFKGKTLIESLRQQNIGYSRSRQQSIPQSSQQTPAELLSQLKNNSPKGYIETYQTVHEQIPKYNYNSNGYETNYQQYNNVNHQYQSSYQSQSLSRKVNDYGYQQQESQQTVSPIGTFKQVELNYLTNADEGIKIHGMDLNSYKYGKSGASVSKSLQENLQMKYSITQDQAYHVEWDPEILADLKSINH